MDLFCFNQYGQWKSEKLLNLMPYYKKGWIVRTAVWIRVKSILKGIQMVVLQWVHKQKQIAEESAFFF